MQPTTSRQFQRAARQRLTAAEALLREQLTLDAQYLAGYTIECSLKALILHHTPANDLEKQLLRITSSSKMHRPEVLFGILVDLHIAIPTDLKKRLIRFTRHGHTTELRYETGRRLTGETRGFLKIANDIHAWVEEQLP